MTFRRIHGRTLLATAALALAAGSVDVIRLKRVVDVMHQFLGFPAFDITPMLTGSDQGGKATG